MPTDPLSDVLRSVRLRGSVFYYVSLREDWAAETPGSADVARAVMPGADHVIAYHMVVKGQGWVATEGEPPVRLSQGDIVMFPRGDGHVLSHAPGARALPDDSDWQFTTRHDAKPITVSWHRGVLRPDPEVPVRDATTVLVCGFIACDLKPFNPLINAMPRLLHQDAAALLSWLGPMLDLAVRETHQRRAGSAAVLERVSEMIFVDAARRYLDALPESASGWLGALRDRHVGKAIALLHERPAHPWTVDALGREVGLARSALHERFVALTGTPPMQYLTQWRMQRGATLLRQGHATVASIAQDVGYDSEAAFARAFKRELGHSPAAWRKQQLHSGQAAA
jgi:AraC-like DNA-binding protein